MSHGFKLDMGCVERDEERVEFLAACSRLDEKTVFKMVDVKGVEPAAALDAIGQNCIHFVTCSSVAVAAANHKGSSGSSATPSSASSTSSAGSAGMGGATAAAASSPPGGATAAFQDAVSRQTALIHYLVQNGADVNCARSSDGWTPLFLAVILNITPMVSLLLQVGAKATTQDLAGLTAEDYADKYRLRNVKDILVHRCVRRLHCNERMPLIDDASYYSRSKVPHSRFSCVTRGPALAESVVVTDVKETKAKISEEANGSVPAASKESSSPASTTPMSSSASAESSPPKQAVTASQ